MTSQPGADLVKAGQLVDQAIRAATPPADLIERRMRPESAHTWQEPAPLAGLRAALTVARTAERRAHAFAVQLRGDGTASWAQVADLLGVPYSEEYSRPERAYELVRGPGDNGAPFYERNVHWNCGGPLGCGRYITDRGPYEGHPADNEDGHADNCRRAAAEAEAYRQASEERERRARVSQDVYETLSPAEQAVIRRCWWSMRRGGEIDGRWSTSEQLEVALILRRDDHLNRTSYSSRLDVIQRVYGKNSAGVDEHLAKMHTAATGES